MSDGASLLDSHCTVVFSVQNANTVFCRWNSRFVSNTSACWTKLTYNLTLLLPRQTQVLYKTFLRINQDKWLWKYDYILGWFIHGIWKLSLSEVLEEISNLCIVHLYSFVPEILYQKCCHCYALDQVRFKEVCNFCTVQDYRSLSKL